MTSTNIQDYDPMTLTFTPRYEEFEDGRHPEDGEPMFGQAHYVVAEAPNGVRWYRDVGYAINTVIEEDWGPAVQWSISPTTLATRASKLSDRLEASRTRRLNHEVWHFAGACYGSHAYDVLGLEADTAAEERAAGEWR